MFCVENSQRITKYMLLSLLYFGSAFSATIETAQRMGDDEDEGIYSEYEDVSINGDDEDILRHDFFRFTTRKRYIWEDWIVPTRDPVGYRDESPSPIFFYYFVIPVAICTFAIISVYICVKNCGNDCCSVESDSHSSMSSDRFTTVHRPPIRRNQYADSRREPAMRDLFSELDSYGGAAHATEATISFINSTYVSSIQGRREPDNTVAEKPPDYYTVRLSDLVNPTQPAFPVVKSDSEAPPPEYGK